MNNYLSKNFLIWRDAEQLVLLVEQSVSYFSRCHKYTLGSEMRTQLYQASRRCRRGKAKGCYFVDAREPLQTKPLYQLWLLTQFRQQGMAYVWVSEYGAGRHLKHRQLAQLFIPTGAPQ